MTYTLKDITFGYSKSPVLTIPNLEIPAGEITALVGPNGSGKTTLLHLLGFLRTPRTGEICFFGDKVTEKNMLAFRRRTALLSQNPYLFHCSVLANVEWGLKVRGVSHNERRARALASLDRVGLGGVKNRPARRLSGGEAQRVAMARVLALEPEVLFLDEPATYMDRESVAFIEKIVVDLNRERGTNVFFTTHDINKGYALAHKVLSLIRGSLVPASLANYFRGNICGTCFDTGCLRIHLPAGVKNGTHISIDPAHIVVSKESLASSMRNSFQGRIVAILEENGKVRMDLISQERFQVIITAESLALLDLRLGDEVWLSFKSTAVKVY
jgi:molybdopterin-binding protein